MSFLDALGALGEAGGLDAGRSLIGPTLAQGVREGLSGAEMLRGLQSVGQGIRSVDFYHLLSEVRASLGAAETWSAQALDQVPGSGAFVSHTGSAYRGYEYRVPIFYRTLGTDIHEVNRTVFSVRTAAPITPQQAIDMANEQFGEGMTGGRYPGQEFLGNGTVGLHHFDA